MRLGDETASVSAGDAVVIPPGTKHKLIAETISEHTHPRLFEKKRNTDSADSSPPRAGQTASRGVERRVCQPCRD
jgi:hypothetical protein